MRSLESEHMVKAEAAVAAHQSVIAKEPTGRIPHHHVCFPSRSGSGHLVKPASIIPEPRAGAGDLQMRTRDLAPPAVVEDKCGVARREPRPGSRVDQMAERVVSRLAQSQKKPRR